VALGEKHKMLPLPSSPLGMLTQNLNGMLSEYSNGKYVSVMPNKRDTKAKKSPLNKV